MYTFIHSFALTQKILTFMSETGECQQQKHTQHAPPTKMECDYLNGLNKKRLHTQKSHPNWCTPTDVGGECRRSWSINATLNSGSQMNHWMSLLSLCFHFLWCCYFFYPLFFDDCTKDHTEWGKATVGFCQPISFHINDDFAGNKKYI